MARHCVALTRSACATARSFSLAGETRSFVSSKISSCTANNNATSTRRFASISRLPAELACAQSLVPLHSAVAAARLTSCLSVNSRSCRALSQEFGLSVP